MTPSDCMYITKQYLKKLRNTHTASLTLQPISNHDCRLRAAIVEEANAGWYCNQQRPLRYLQATFHFLSSLLRHPAGSGVLSHTKSTSESRSWPDRVAALSVWTPPWSQQLISPVGLAYKAALWASRAVTDMLDSTRGSWTHIVEHVLWNFPDSYNKLAKMVIYSTI